MECVYLEASGSTFLFTSYAYSNTQVVLPLRSPKRHQYLLTIRRHGCSRYYSIRWNLNGLQHNKLGTNPHWTLLHDRVIAFYLKESLSSAIGFITGFSSSDTLIDHAATGTDVGNRHYHFLVAANWLFVIDNILLQTTRECQSVANHRCHVNRHLK